jgi:hypothetical protein
MPALIALDYGATVTILTEHVILSKVPRLEPSLPKQLAWNFFL